MIPMRTSTIFKSRWMALLWAAGIIWFAYDFAAPSAAGNATTTSQITDANGAPVTPRKRSSSRGRERPLGSFHSIRSMCQRRCACGRAGHVIYPAQGHVGGTAK